MGREVEGGEGAQMGRRRLQGDLLVAFQSLGGSNKQEEGRIHMGRVMEPFQPNHSIVL